MRSFAKGVTGAARPPRRFGRLLPAAAVAALMTGQACAQEADIDCRYVRVGAIQMEGFDGATPFGMQFIVRDSRWVFGPSHGGVTLQCPTCVPEAISRGLVAIGRAPFLDPIREGELRAETGQEKASWLEFALHPRAIAMALWRLTMHLPVDVKPHEAAATPVTLWGLPGAARVVTVTLPNRVVPAVAVALVDRCFPLFAVLFRKDEGEVNVEDVQSTSLSLGVLKYQPERHVLSPGIEFPLGDARKRWEEDTLPQSEPNAETERK